MKPKQQHVIGLEIDHDSAAWWAAVARHEFQMPRCGSCSRWSFPPMPTCPYCAAENPALHTATGRGTIYSWITAHEAMETAFNEDVPYTVLLVETDEGPRVLGRALEDFSPEPGLRVHVDFYEVGEHTLVGFRRSTSQAPEQR